MDVVSVKLRSKHDRRVKSGHPWVFSNELEGGAKGLPPGGAVDVLDRGGAFVGRGYANPNSLIAVRIMARSRPDVDSTDFFVQRLQDAVAHRELLYPGRRSLRLVSSEGDQLPGLVIDRYDDVLVVQITTLGIEHRLGALREAIDEVLAPKGAVLRAPERMRALEGLQPIHEAWFGEVPDEVVIDELGVRFAVNPLGGAKTGHFYDQADNRYFAGSLCRGRSVLDVYAHTGGWAMHALVGGATEAVCIERSDGHAEAIARNAELNGVAMPEVVSAEARRSLQKMIGEGRVFGAVVLDPPAFAKNKKSAGNALRGYAELNALGMALLEPGGLLFTSSCSYHVHEDRFLQAVMDAARQHGRVLRLVRRGEQSADHPVLPHMPESRYLKTFALQLL